MFLQTLLFEGIGKKDSEWANRTQSEKLSHFG